MSTKRHQVRRLASAEEIAAAYNITVSEAARWKQSGARITRAPEGLAEWSPAYTDAPAAIHRTTARRGGKAGS